MAMQQVEQPTPMEPEQALEQASTQNLSVSADTARRHSNPWRS
jgi:hypothetical protein